MMFLEDNTKRTRKFDINEATSQIISMTFKVKNFPLNNITINNPTIYFLKINLINDFFNSQTQSCNYYVIELQDKLDSNHFKFLLFLLCSLGIMVGVLLMLIPIHNLVLKSQRESIKIFLEIPMIKVKMLYNKCESFINQIAGNIYFIYINYF